MQDSMTDLFANQIAIKKDFGTIASYNLAVALFMFAVMNIAAPYIAIFSDAMN